MRKPVLALSCAFLLACALAASAQDVLIRNASVVDGTGAPAQPGDVRISGGRIDAVGRSLAPRQGETVIDARGLTLAPGFIDTHSHHDGGIAERRDALAAVSQGITTIVVGQDGSSRFPLASFFAQLEKQPAAVNVASFAGHGTLRRRVMGDDYKRAATDAEIARMKDLLREEMAAGALGLATGLEYDPGIFSRREEVIELAKVAAAAGGRYTSHMRSEDRDFWLAVDELLTIGREARIPVQVSHMKLAMRGLWGQADTLVEILDKARKEGIDVVADIYPWTMWQSTLTVLYPKRNFTDREETDFILKEVASADDLLIGRFSPNRAYEGKTVAQIAKMRSSDPATTLMALIAESQGPNDSESVVATGMDERDIVKLLRWPYANICSDGQLNGAHPRGFGSFTRVLGRYVREQKVITLEEAIRKMTTLAAANAGLTDRGAIRAGVAADLVLFDPNTVAERASVAQPHATSVGIDRVLVNGVVVYESGKTTGAFPGRVLRRTESVTDRVDRLVRDEMQRQHIPGVALAIVHKGTTTARGYGYANVEHHIPVTDETIFQSGSLGKMFTAAAVMLQVEDGKLSLDDPLTRFYPDAPKSWNAITVRHLLNHTSGIPDYTTSSFDYRRDYTEDELAKLAFAQKLEFPAGSRWNYSNTGYALLGFIVRKVSGKFYGDVLAERVFKPAGMTTARVITEAEIVPNRAAGYRVVAGQLKNQHWVSPVLNTTADGSLYWSLRDLIAWNSAVAKRAVLKPSSWDLILSPAKLASGKTYPYGFGWSIETRNNQPMHHHGGSWQGFRTQYARFLGDDLAIIVLANAESDPSRILEGVAAIINPALAAKTPTAPIEDTEPRVAQKLRDVLEALRKGTLSPSDFAYVRAGFFPEAAEFYKKELETLGAITRVRLFDRQEIGDDRVYLYEVTFGAETRYVRLGLAPDDRVSGFGMRTRL